jgi:ubiquinone/menaquinone biosynthesis C-methylase UbiE
MKLHDPNAYAVACEQEIMQRLLPLRDARVLELGCGRAELTRLVACELGAAAVVATEVDATQHEKNLLIDDLPNVAFRYAGAEAIPEPDNTFDVVLMFKSLHHVPVAQMDDALAEIARVLRPGGLAYISEPVFAGTYNEILRLFHDEREVREQAFNALQRVVRAGRLELAEECFFNVPESIADFAAFEDRTIHVTHTRHSLDDALYREVRDRFNAHVTDTGAHFQVPMRVDLLRKPLWTAAAPA